MKVTHREDDRLIAYVLDELEESERKAVQVHLAQCRTCSEVVASLMGAMEAFRATPRPHAPAQILVDLLETQAEASARVPSRSWWRLPFRVAAAVAVVALLFLTGFWAGRLTAPPPSPPAPVFQSGPAVHSPLPEPPEIPFQTALAHGNESI